MCHYFQGGGGAAGFKNRSCDGDLPLLDCTELEEF